MFYFYNDTSKPAPFVRNESEPKFDGWYCNKDCPCLKIKITFLETIRVCNKYNTSLALYKCPIVPRCARCWNEYGE
jgi:hypothetical protein